MHPYFVDVQGKLVSCRATNAIAAIGIALSKTGHAATDLTRCVMHSEPHGLVLEDLERSLRCVARSAA